MKTCTSIAAGFVLLLYASALFAAAPWNGLGTKENPFQITNETDLRAVAEKVNNREYADSCFKVTQNITLSPMTFTPIGRRARHEVIDGYNSFKGIFDGGNFTISGLYINDSTMVYGGLFGVVENGTIQKVKLDNFSITVSTGAGGLAGSLSDTSKVEDCFVSGSIVAPGGFCGGLIGLASADPDVEPVDFIQIKSCGAKVTITTAKSYNNGGLIGQAQRCHISNSSAKGTIVTETGRSIGGLVGYFNIGTFTNCYATGTISGTAQYVGGLIGGIEEECSGDSSYAAVKVAGSTFVDPFLGGAEEDIPLTLTNCHYDNQINSMESKFKAEGQSTAVMKAAGFISTLGTASFKKDLNINKGYPILTWENGSPGPIVVESPEFFPASQSYSTPALTVTLINKTADAKMEYGFRADLSDAKAYKSPFSISGTQTVYARAKLAESVSSVSSATYTFIQPKPAAVVVLGTKVEVTADSFHLTDPLSKKKTKLEALYSELFPKPGKVAKQKKMNVKMVSDTAFEDKGIVRLLNQKLYKQALKNALTNTTAKVLAADSGIWAVQKDSAVITVTVKLKKKNRSDAIWIKTVPPTLDSYRFVDSAYLVVSVKNAGAKPKAFFEYLEASRANVLKLKKMTVSFLPEKKWAKTGIDFKTFFPGKDIAVFKTSAKKVEKLPAVHDLVLDNKNGLGVK